VFDSVLVANRGEIAVRIMRTCRRLGVRTVAVFAAGDETAPHVTAADVAVRLEQPDGRDATHLDVDAVVHAARRTGATAVHPGYGFLSENAALPEALAAAGIAWVGPSPDVIRLLGDKAAAKERLGAAGVPVLPGTTDTDLTDDELLAAAAAMGWPVLLKAVAGGGGKGMRAVHAAGDAPAALAAARREAVNAFGDGRMIVEKLVERPRHVEVQVLGDTHGTVLHLLERECSLQRRHQKVVEEAPAAHLAPDVRAALHAAAVTAARTVGYVNAGTVEFLLDADGSSFHFLEMNTRLQVEHPVTELVTGLDLVELQLRVAAGEPLPLAQDDVRAHGHAIEARLYAEDPAVGFLPQTGRLLTFTHPSDPDWQPTPRLRVDTGVGAGSVVGTRYDPMLAKLVAHGDDRAAALRDLRALVVHTSAFGVRTNLEWLGDLLADPAVVADEVATDWLDGWDWVEPPLPAEALAGAAVALSADRRARRSTATGAGSPWDTLGPRRSGSGGWTVRLGDRDRIHPCVVRTGPDGSHEVLVLDDEVAGTGATVVVGGDPHPTDDGLAWQAVGREPAFTRVEGDVVWVLHGGRTRPLTVLPATLHRDLDAVAGATALTSPMPGQVVTVEVGEGDHVLRGATLVVVEAMKMEHPVTAPADGTVTDLAVAAGDTVEAGQALLTVVPDGDEEA
jgi:acetyl-CoA/propionyl-CoA carboxylase biotin carboxyl carrier protein